MPVSYTCSSQTNNTIRDQRVIVVQINININIRFYIYNTYNGVQQGEIMSPVLFSIYMDAFFVLLYESGIGRHVEGV